MIIAEVREKSIFPRCELYEFRIVNHLPDGCVFRAENPLDALHALRVRAFQLGDGGADRLTESIAMHGRADVCSSCTSRLSSHPRIVCLRQRQEVEAA